MIFDAVFVCTYYSVHNMQSSDLVICVEQMWLNLILENRFWLNIDDLVFNKGHSPQREKYAM